MNDADKHAAEMAEMGDPLATAAPKTYTPRQAYEEDCRRRPFYHDGEQRKTWEQLTEHARETWVKKPYPRAQHDFSRAKR